MREAECAAVDDMRDVSGASDESELVRIAAEGGYLLSPICAQRGGAGLVFNAESQRRREGEGGAEEKWETT